MHPKQLDLRSESSHEYLSSQHLTGHIKDAWFPTLSQAYAHFCAAQVLQNPKNPWSQKDIGKLIKDFVSEHPNRNFLEQLQAEFMQSEQGISEIVAHLRVCPDCARAIKIMPG